MIPECSSEWFEIVNRILCDNYPPKVEMVFLHAETRDNENSSLQAGAEFYKSGFAQSIGILRIDVSILDELCQKYRKAGAQNVEQIVERISKTKDKGLIAGYVGFLHWKNKLERLGVNEKDIILIEPDYRYYLSTDAESEGLVEFCSKRRYTDICVTAPPLHQVRAYISDISAVLHKGMDLRVYSRAGKTLNWTEKIIHSQGTTEKKRAEFLREELNKILKYNETGNPPLASLEEVIDYLNNRDSIL